MTAVDAAAEAPATVRDAPRAGAVASPDTTGARAAVQARMDSLVEREARAKLGRRLRQTIRLGTWFWLAFSVMDVLAILRGVEPWWLLPILRLAPVGLAWGLYRTIRAGREPTLRRLRAVEVTVFGALAISVSVMFGLQGGWTSSRIPSLILIVLSYAVLLGSEWRRSLGPIAAQVLALPITLGAMSLFVPRLREQLADPAALEAFAVLYFPVLGGGAIGLIGGHTTWRLREEVAEARSIGRYKLRRRLAAGGMGEIWAAYHAGLRRDVAVKLIHAERRDDAIAIERFDREVQTLAELTHPNTVRIFDHGATETGVLYYAMELLDGTDLQHILDEEGPMGCERAVRLITQAAQALGEAHERGIVHRDVKPANLLVLHRDRAGEFVKVIDFGIAKLDAAQTLTETGMVVGTPGYIAPEVITGGEVSPRADVYGLGMVLHVLLAGELPHRGPTPMSVVQQALEVDVPRLTALREDVPEEVAEVVARAVARDPFARPADGTELAHALRDAM